MARAELRDSLEFLFPDSRIRSKGARPFEVSVPRGGTASAQVLLTGLEPHCRVRARLERKDREVEDARWFRLLAVPVEANTGPVGFIEKNGEVNPHAIRRAPFRVYDAMEPMKGRISSKEGTAVLRLQLPVSRSARRGKKDFTVEIEAGKERATLPLAVYVHGTTVPEAGNNSLPYTNWFSVSHIAERHGLSMWSEPHWRMIGKYAELMAHARQNMFWCPWSLFFVDQKNRPLLDVKRFRRYVKTFSQAGLHYIEGGHVAGRAGGDWDAERFHLQLTGTPATSIQGNAELQGILKQLVTEMDAQGWRDRWVQHVTDEPTQRNAADYRILSGMVRKYMPGVPLLDATMELGLAGSVDYWCPQCQEYQGHRDAFEKQRELGDRVWYYTCCFPGGPWLNRLLDMELLRPALMGWAMARYRLDGFLHWGLNHYKENQDPFRQSVVSHGGSNSLPAGDTHIVYPGKNGPWSSVRLEAQREGFEDYELLRELWKRDPGSADRIVRRALRRFDDYTKNPSTFRKAQTALYEACESTL